MSKHIASAAVVFLAILVAYFTQQPSQQSPTQQVSGRNNTALFLVSDGHGLHNVHMATIQALRENHPEVEIHVASWAPVDKKVKRLHNKATFHPLNGPSFFGAGLRAMAASGATDITAGIMDPGLGGFAKFSQFVQLYISPWLNEEHFALFEESVSLLESVDPAVVVLDYFMWPAISAAREKNRLHAFVTPNMLADTFAFEQPWFQGYWKYPPWGSMMPFPIPWKDIPYNVWNAIKARKVLSRTPYQQAKREYLEGRGVKSAGSSMNFHGAKSGPDTPWITQTLLGGSFPLTRMPTNVTCTGPILIESAPAGEQDPELTAWLSRAPTILINLGSLISFDEQRAVAFAQALVSLLDDRTDLQVLWKYVKAGDYSEESFRAIAEKHTTSDRFRIVTWLEADPIAILETGNIVAFVHHGGAGSYHEALHAGVPHVVLPLWVDHYNIAALVSYLNIGMIGCQESTPQWTSECLASSITSVIDESGKSKVIRDNSKRLGRISKASPGRVGAAKVIADLAAIGHA
ncbi:family 1 glycosyltransferase [Lophiotrema nucula]|uniref:Family 1 glycosyltransferase n=1 Tax=Lophiotrema nucula TaxID=690887 RepID=A0A6A5YVW3_9PLEO|nr:family 1 glycosyltransferase [Lophiotrema nucula]